MRQGACASLAPSNEASPSRLPADPCRWRDGGLGCMSGIGTASICATGGARSASCGASPLRICLRWHRACSATACAGHAVCRAVPSHDTHGGRDLSRDVPNVCDVGTRSSPLACNAVCHAEHRTPWTGPFDPSGPCQAMSGRHRSRTRSGQSWSPRDRALNSTARYGLTRRADSECRATIVPGGVSIGAARGRSARKPNAGRPSLALPLERPRRTCRPLPSSMRRPVARQRPRHRTLARLVLRHARVSTSRLLTLLNGVRRRWVVRRSTAGRVAAIHLQRLAAARSVHSGAVEDRRRAPEAAAAGTPQRRPGPGSASPHP